MDAYNICVISRSLPVADNLRVEGGSDCRGRHKYVVIVTKQLQTPVIHKFIHICEVF